MRWQHILSEGEEEEEVLCRVEDRRRLAQGRAVKKKHRQKEQDREEKLRRQRGTEGCLRESAHFLRHME